MIDVERPWRRTPIVIGNWKMHTSRDEARALARKVGREVAGIDDVEMVVCPPAPWLLDVWLELRGTRVAVGAQDVHWEPPGACTGECAAEQLTGIASYAIVGHTERRLRGESDEIAGRKLRAVVGAGIGPVLVVGEAADEHRTVAGARTTRRQLRTALDYLDAPLGSLVVAWAPASAIGAAEPLPAPDVEARCAMLRWTVASIWGGPAAERVRMVYEGGVRASSAAGIASSPQVDGVMVGRASLDAAAFGATCRALASHGRGRRDEDNDRARPNGEREPERTRDRATMAPTDLP